MAEKVSSKTDLWKSQFEFNEKLNSDLNDIQEMMNSMMEMIRGLNKSTSSRYFQSSSSSIAVARKCAIPPLEAGIRVTDGAGQPSPLRMDTPRVEESIISLEELTRQIREDKVFEELSQPISIDTAETLGAEDDYLRLQLKSNGLHLNIINRWSESVIKNTYVEGSLTDEAKKDEQSKADKLESMEFIYPKADQVELKSNAQLQASGNGDFGSTIAAKKLSDECLQPLHSPHKLFDEMPDSFSDKLDSGIDGCKDLGYKVGVTEGVSTSQLMRFTKVSCITEFEEVRVNHFNIANRNVLPLIDAGKTFHFNPGWEVETRHQMIKAHEKIQMQKSLRNTTIVMVICQNQILEDLLGFLLSRFLTFMFDPGGGRNTSLQLVGGAIGVSNVFKRNSYHKGNSELITHVAVAKVKLFSERSYLYWTYTSIRICPALKDAGLSPSIDSINHDNIVLGSTYLETIVEYLPHGREEKVGAIVLTTLCVLKALKSIVSFPVETLCNVFKLHAVRLVVQVIFNGESIVPELVKRIMAPLHLGTEWPLATIVLALVFPWVGVWIFENVHMVEVFNAFGGLIKPLWQTLGLSLGEIDSFAPCCELTKYGTVAEAIATKEIFPRSKKIIFYQELTDLVPTARHSFSSVSLIRNERNDDSVLNRADYCKFDEVLGPFSVKHNTRIDIQEVLEPPTFDLLKILGCDFINSNGLKQDFDKMASNLNVEFGVDGILMFVFDPGGNSSLQMDLFIDRDVCEAVLGRPCAISSMLVILKWKSILNAAVCNMLILGEELAGSKLTLFDITTQICNAVKDRATQDKDHGIILLPEGLIGSISEIYALLQEIHGLPRQGISEDNISSQLSPWASALFDFLPPFIRKQLLLYTETDDPAQPSQIETVKFLSLVLNQDFGGQKSSFKHGFQLHLSSNSYDGITIAELQNFVWDPGQCAIFVYILGDKDVFEWVGKRMVCIGDMQWDMIMRYTVNAAKLRNEDFCVWCLTRFIFFFCILEDKDVFQGEGDVMTRDFRVTKCQSRHVQSQLFGEPSLQLNIVSRD